MLGSERPSQDTPEQGWSGVELAEVRCPDSSLLAESKYQKAERTNISIYPPEIDVSSEAGWTAFCRHPAATGKRTVWLACHPGELGLMAAGDGYGGGSAEQLAP